MKRKGLLLLAASAALFAITPVYADTVLYANSAGTDGIRKFDINVAAGTATLLDHFAISVGNGRGVVTVGDTLYYTDASSGFVSTYTLSTHTDNGHLFKVDSASGLSTIAFDGTDLYFGDYSGTNNVYKYSLSGTALATIPLANCTGFCDGLEFAKGNLISNRGDTVPPYDVYSTTGTLLTPIFIDAGAHSGSDTGIAFDGTDYFVSEIFNGSVGVYDSTGAFIKSISFGADGTRLFEDLSVDYNLVIPPPPPGVPEPASIVLFGSVLVGLAGFKKLQRRLRNN